MTEQVNIIAQQKTNDESPIGTIVKTVPFHPKQIIMPDQNRINLLIAIAGYATPGTPARLSFNTLSKSLGLSKQEMDLLLVALNKERYISQYAKKGVDGFTLMINQKALDAIEDEAAG